MKTMASWRVEVDMVMRKDRGVRLLWLVITFTNETAASRKQLNLPNV